MDNALPTGGDIYMAVSKNIKATKREKAIAQHTLTRQRRWYKCQKFASDMFHSVLDDERLDVFIDQGRHTLAELIPDRSDID